MHQLAGHLPLAVTHSIEHGFDHVREFDDRIQTEQSGGALDRMHCTEQRVDRVRIGFATIAREQGALDFLAELLRFG